MPLSSMMSEDKLGKLLRQIADQEALVRRMVTQGAPTQAAEDRLCELQREVALAGIIGRCIEQSVARG